MNRRTLIAAAVVTALITLGVVFSARDFIYEGVVVPLLYLIWLGNLAINSADQAFIWIAVVFILLVALLRGLRLRPGPLPQVSSPRVETVEKGRVAFWAVKMVLGSRGEYSRRYFQLELKKLLLGTLGFREGRSPREMEEGLRSGSLPTPAGLEGFIHAWVDEGYTLGPGFWQRLVDFVTWKRRKEPALDLAEVEQVVRFMEDQLEIRRESND